MSWPKPCDQSNGDSRPCAGGFCHACEGCDIHCDCANTDEVRHTTGFSTLMDAARYCQAHRMGRVSFVTWRTGLLRVHDAMPVVEPYAMIQPTARGLRITNQLDLLTLN